MTGSRDWVLADGAKAGEVPCTNWYLRFKAYLLIVGAHQRQGMAIIGITSGVHCATRYDFIIDCHVVNKLALLVV